MFAEIQQSAFAKTKHVPHITEVFKEFRAVILLGNSYGENCASRNRLP